MNSEKQLFLSDSDNREFLIVYKSMSSGERVEILSILILSSTLTLEKSV